MKTLCFFLILPSLAFSQHADKWYFGVNAGIDFSNGAAAAVYGGALNASGGTAAIADSTGALLFYTDGLTIWDKYHLPMPNGTSLAGGFGSQPVVIVPDPGSTDRYYIFTTDGAGGSAGLQYSV